MPSERTVRCRQWGPVPGDGAMSRWNGFRRNTMLGFHERQRKGIDGSVQVNGHNHYYWKEYTLPMEHLEHLDFTIPSVPGTPGFYEFSFEADETGDTFLDFTGWGKGCILVNGFNIGRFWEIGPQKRLYIPGPLLKKGTNTILIFETEGKVPGIITLCDEPDLG